MEKPLTGKVALVTGGSRGIGAATASVLAERGFRVVVNYHASAPPAEEVVAAIRAAGGEAVAIQADVTAPGDVAGMVGDIAQRWGGVDVLVHNALIPYAITSFAELAPPSLFFHYPSRANKLGDPNFWILGKRQM